MANDKAFKVKNDLDVGGNVTVAGNLTVEGSTISLDNATVQTFTWGDNDKAVFGDGSDLQIYHDGTTSKIDGNVSFTNNVTLSGGTADGVAYLNGSKVLTTGSALTFDGTSFSATGTTTVNSANSTAVALVVKGETGNGIRQRFIGQASSGQYNWQIGASITAAGEFSFMPSTAADGATFTSSVYNITPTGVSYWSVGGSEQMRLTSTGLGIGTSSPTSKLTIGTGTYSAAASGTTGMYTTASGLEMLSDSYFFGSRTGATRMVLDSSGNLGLGVTPSAWSTNNSVRAFQNAAGGLWNFDTTFQLLGQNYYYNSAGNRIYSTTAAASEYRQFSGTHSWHTAPSGTAGNAISFTQAMTLDASGNLGIGTTSPDAKLDVTSAGTASTYTVSAVIQDGTYPASGNPTLEFNGFIGGNGYRSGVGSIGGQSLAFYTPSSYGVAPTERARIDSSGNLLVGTTSTLEGHTFYKENGTATFAVADSAARTAVYFHNGAYVGSIVTSGSSTSYNTSSDYRLKENISPMANALAVVQQLKPVTYNWKTDGSEGQGFIAHELQAVVPDCVTGEKDAVDADGNPVYQGIDTSFLVATLTAAIQEQQAIIEDLKSRLTAAGL